MIKESPLVKDNMFLPAFGSRPHPLIGREILVDQFLDGLTRPPGHPLRASFYLGQRGMGKTALLLELAAQANERDYVVARVTANERMLVEIIQTIQADGEGYIPKKKKGIKGISAGALGFSFGLTFTDDTERKYGFRIKLSMLADALAEQGKGILILVDEVQASGEYMRELATTFQHLIGEEKNVVIAMAGLPHAISAVLNDEVLTFLNRANRVWLDFIPLPVIRLYYSKCFSRLDKDIEPSSLEKAVRATRGYPYLLQLVGYYILEYTDEAKEISAAIVDEAIETSRQALIENVHKTCLKPLSEKDLAFLEAMAKEGDESRMADIAKRLNASNSFAQQYRKRLIETGVVTSEKRGWLKFTIPYLGDYLRNSL
jgi:hypothetical protein